MFQIPAQLPFKEGGARAKKMFPIHELWSQFPKRGLYRGLDMGVL